MNISPKWWQGVIGAAINSSATTLANVLVDPGTFNLFTSDGAWNVGKTAFVAAVLGAILYLKEHKPWDDGFGQTIKLATIAFLVTNALLFTMGCAGMTAAWKPVENPNLQVEGQIAARGTQLVAMITAAQTTIRPMVETNVLTTNEGLSVARVFTYVFAGAERLVKLLEIADRTRDLVERVAILRDVASQTRAMLRSLTRASRDVANPVARMAVDDVVGTVTDAMTDMLIQTGATR